MYLIPLYVLTGVRLKKPSLWLGVKTASSLTILILGKVKNIGANTLLALMITLIVTKLLKMISVHGEKREKMRKLTIVLLMIAVMLSLTSCNRGLIDLKYQYDYAIIKMPNGEVVEGKIIKWRDYDGEQLQLVLEDGNTYLVNSFYTTLISYGEEDE